MKAFSLVLVFALVFAACGGTEESESTTTLAATTTVAATQPAQAGTGQPMGGSSGMQARHQATVPAPYAGLTNPVAADEDSLARGAEAYATCAVCHGDSGLGDGAAGAALDPAPANIAHTSQMMSDAYFFWRISEGGADFGTAMPAWDVALDEQARWDLINYIQALGEGSAMPGGGMGMGMGQGQGSNAQAQAVQQAALLEIGVEQGVITQDEADAFAEAHPIVDARMVEVRGTMLTVVLEGLVASGDLTQDQADTFLDVHDRLSEAGLLP